MKKTTNTNPRQEIQITSFQQLNDAVQAPVVCRLRLSDGEGGEKVLRIPCRRMHPKTREQADELLLKVVPPWSPKLKDYDSMDLIYRNQMAKAQKVARALIIYCGCELVAREKPSLTDPEQIYEFVQGLLAEPMLEALALTIEGGGISISREVESRANFTSTPPSGS